MCDECAQLRQVIAGLQASENELVLDREATERINRDLTRKLIAAERKLKQTLEESPLAQDIKDVLKDWQTKTGHTKTKIPLDGVRAEKVRARLKNFTVDELKRANSGAARFPFVVNAQRRATGPEDQRYDDAELIFRNEKTVEKFIALADRPDGPEATVDPTPPAPVSPALMLLGPVQPPVRPREPVHEALDGLTYRKIPWYAVEGRDDRFESTCPLCSEYLLVGRPAPGVVRFGCAGMCEADAVAQALGVREMDERRAA